MALREGSSQKCKGIFGRRTHTCAKVRIAVKGLKQGVQGIKHKLSLPKTKGHNRESDPYLLRDQTRQ